MYLKSVTTISRRVDPDLYGYPFPWTFSPCVFRNCSRLTWHPRTRLSHLFPKNLLRSGDSRHDLLFWREMVYISHEPKRRFWTLLVHTNFLTSSVTLEVTWVMRT